VQTEIAEKWPATDVSIHIVWLPMVPGDNARATRRTGRSFPPHVHQYYDPDRLVGHAYYRDVFPGCLRDALRVMPKDHPLYDTLHEWSQASRSEGPIWDAVFFYRAGSEWTDGVPVPAFWSMQVAFFPQGDDGVTGTFFRNSCSEPPVDSDWHEEVRRAAANHLSAPSATDPETR